MPHFRHNEMNERDLDHDWPPMRLSIGDHQLDTRSGELNGPTGSSRLEPRVLQVLLELARKPGELVTKEELFRTVWAETAVSDDVLWRCIAALRRELDDDPKSPRVIETLARRGYRLLVPIHRPPDKQQSITPSAPAFPALRATALIVAAVVLIAGLVWARPAVLTGSAPSALNVLPIAPEEWTAAQATRMGWEYYERRTAEDLQRARELFERAIDIDDGHASAWAGLADTISQHIGRFDGDPAELTRALEAGTRAVTLDPTSAEAHKAHGFALTGVGRIEEAMDAYRRALEIAPGFDHAVVNLATLHAGRGRYAEALALYVTLESGGPSRAIDLHNIGDALAQTARPTEARRYYEAALAVDPLQVETIGHLVRLDVLAGNTESARARVDKAVSRRPENRQLGIVSAALATVEGDLLRAQQEFRRALAGVSPERDVEAHIRLAWVDQQLGGEQPLAEVMRAYARVLPEVFEQRQLWRFAQMGAEIAMWSGDHDAALEWLRKGLELGHVDEAWLRIDPVFDSLRGSTVFEQILDRAAVARIAAGRASVAALPGSISPDGR